MFTIGGALGGEGGMMLAFVFALAMNGIRYWFSDKIVLRRYGARETDPLSLASALRKLRLATERTFC